MLLPQNVVSCKILKYKLVHQSVDMSVRISLIAWIGSYPIRPGNSPMYQIVDAASDAKFQFIFWVAILRPGLNCDLVND